MIFEAVRKAMLAGFGVQEKITELVDELVKKGELSEKQGAKLVKEWGEKAEKSAADMNKTVSELMNTTMSKMNLPTKADIDKVDKKLKALSARIKRLEEHAGVEHKEA